MSKLISNLENMADVLKTAKLLIDKITADSKAATNPKEYIQANKIKVLQKTKAELEQSKTERAKILMGDIIKQQERLAKYMERNRPKNETMLFMKAERINQAKNVDEAISIYKRGLDRMTPSDREASRPIFDEALQEYIARTEPAAAFRAEEVINEYRSDIEKHYIEELKIAHEIREQSKILDAQIENQVQALEEGKDPTVFNWPQIVNEINDNAKHAIRGPEPVPAFQINPYDTEAEAEPAEAAAE
jgi:hypothetical protein